MPALKDVGERAVIEQLKRIFDRGLPVGLGPDVGVIDWGEDWLVITTDAVNVKTHLPPGAAPGQGGWYLVAVNLSDVPAAGAFPLGFVAAPAMPRDTDLDWVKALARGMEECARQFGIPIVGGDTKESEAMTLAGTAVGKVAKSRILLRTGARPGDVVVVTGDLGRGGGGPPAPPDRRGDLLRRERRGDELHGRLRRTRRDGPPALRGEQGLVPDRLRHAPAVQAPPGRGPEDGRGPRAVLRRGL